MQRRAEQLNQILSELKEQRSQVSNVAVSNFLVTDEAASAARGGVKVAPNAAPAKKPGAGERLLLKQRSEKLSELPPVTFWLRCADGNEPAQGKK